MMKRVMLGAALGVSMLFGIAQAQAAETAICYNCPPQ